MDVAKPVRIRSKSRWLDPRCSPRYIALAPDGFQHGTQKVRIGFVRSPLEKEVIVTVNRLRDLKLPLDAVALESLAESVGLLGLGRFDVDLAYRQRGLLLVIHRHSPFAEILDREGPRCDVLAGLHAGFLSYLAGRGLDAVEISCARKGDEPCRFVVGTERRLERLFDPVEGSSDANLLVALGVRPQATGGEDG